jgi:hypothetical protein
MRRLLIALAFAIIVISASPTVSSSGFTTNGPSAGTVVAYSQIPFFDTEKAAQKHCPADTVVWLNTNSGIYHLKGERWYGRTKYGAYVCKKEADTAGYLETLNGQ